MGIKGRWEAHKKEESDGVPEGHLWREIMADQKSLACPPLDASLPRNHQRILAQLRTGHCPLACGDSGKWQNARMAKELKSAKPGAKPRPDKPKASLSCPHCQAAEEDV
eukprot:gene16736-8943_t